MKSKLSSSTTSLGVPFKQRWPFLFKSCTGCGQGARHTFPPTPTSHPFSLSLLLAESSPRYSCPLLFPLWQLMSPKPCFHSLRPFAWLKVFSIFPCDHTGNSASGGVLMSPLVTCPPRMAALLRSARTPARRPSNSVCSKPPVLRIPHLSSYLRTDLMKIFDAQSSNLLSCISFPSST